MKSLFKSKKFYFNALTVLLAFGTYFGYTPDPAVTDKVTGFLVLASPFVNLILTMFYTKKGLSITGK